MQKAQYDSDWHWLACRRALCFLAASVLAVCLPCAPLFAQTTPALGDALPAQYAAALEQPLPLQGSFPGDSTSLLPDAPLAQAPQRPGSANGTVTGTVLDSDGLVVPNAKVVLEGPTPEDRSTTTSNGDGLFTATGIRSGVEYKAVISLTGFADWTSPVMTLGPGQAYQLDNIKLALASVDTTVEAVSPEALAIEQESAEVHQRLFGIIPNFYVVYDHAFAPLSSRLKYRLAFKASFDVVNLGAAFFLGAINQAADRPDYRQGLIGYGERVGAVYVDGITDIIFGGAVLPAALHQDPRYFYQGSGSKKSRTLHAIASPFLCKGDNGKREFNYSSIGGDLISGGFSNLYYPPRDRGVGLLLSTAAIATGGRMVNALAQEFVFSKFTSRGTPKN